MLGLKMEIFQKKRHSEILVREKVFRPPKLGARSPPLECQHSIISPDCLSLGIQKTRSALIISFQLLGPLSAQMIFLGGHIN